MDAHDVMNQPNTRTLRSACRKYRASATRSGRLRVPPPAMVQSSDGEDDDDANYPSSGPSSPSSEVSDGLSASPPVSPVLGRDGKPANLIELIELLNTNAGLRMYKSAFRENMLFKIEKYGQLLAEAEREVTDALAKIRIQMPVLKEAAELDAKDTTDNWNIFESISQTFLEAKDRASQFEAIRNRARDRMSGSMQWPDVYAKDEVRDLRDELVQALDNLSNFASQPHIVVKVVDIVSSFIKDPRLFRRKLMNFMMMGGAGTGKTTIAEAIGDVFARAGMFVGNTLKEAGRAELVGQYEGQTVARTRNFLTSQLDNGVIFIDEAYAITPWQNGKPEGYGSEAATAMVEFMTRFAGMYCIITAGYEREMTRYFLPTNEGLSRRFPYKFVLRDMNADDLIVVFKRALLKAQGLDVPNGKGVALLSDTYFTPDAYAYLKQLIHTCTRGTVTYDSEEDKATRKTYKRVRRFEPTWELMYTLFENQAGSMTNLADEAVTVLMTTLSFKEVIEVQKRTGGIARPVFKPQDRGVMRDIIVQRILNTALSQSDAYLQQLEQVESLI